MLLSSGCSEFLRPNLSLLSCDLSVSLVFRVPNTFNSREKTVKRLGALLILASVSLHSVASKEAQIPPSTASNEMEIPLHWTCFADGPNPNQISLDYVARNGVFSGYVIGREAECLYALLDIKPILRKSCLGKPLQKKGHGITCNQWTEPTAFISYECRITLNYNGKPVQRDDLCNKEIVKSKK